MSPSQPPYRLDVTAASRNQATRKMSAFLFKASYFVISGKILPLNNCVRAVPSIDQLEQMANISQSRQHACRLCCMFAAAVGQ
jgi:recombinational DNA repair protein RecR